MQASESTRPSIKPAIKPAIKSVPAGPLKVAFLAGADSASTRLTIETVCAVPNVVPVGILLDIHSPSSSGRWKNLRRNLRRDGPAYMGYRAIRAIRDWLDARVDRVVPQAEVEGLLRKAFPERCFSLQDLAARYACPLYPIDNLNSPAAADQLRKTGADIGIALGTRVLKRGTFSAPGLGCLNLHKGRVPDFRGMPPAFWELYEGAENAGVTVHFVDDGLDTGDIVKTLEVPVHPLETVQSLQTKLDFEGARVLAESLAQLRDLEPIAQSPTAAKTRTKPTRAQQAELLRRKPYLLPPESDVKRIFKNVLYLSFFRMGIYGLVRWTRRTLSQRGAIVLHHRVNDISDDPLTTSSRAFAEQLCALRRYYRVVPSSSIVAAVRGQTRLEPGTAAIHFDDCYRDVYQVAARLLVAAGMPATAFISSGFIDTDRVFDHDRRKYPQRFENLHGEEVRDLLNLGFEVGAHTVNHVDLGLIPPEQAAREVNDSKRDIEALTGQPITLFSFPFGGETNIRPEVREMVRRGGFSALFSAYGGFVRPNSDAFDIPRLGTNSRYRALDLMMELEGLSLAHWKRRLFFFRRRQDPPASS